MTNSGFITTLYVVIVPLIHVLFRRHAVSWRHWALVALALVGTALVCNWQHLEWNVGDGLTLLAATAGALQIIAVESRAKAITSAFNFNALQTAWALPWCVAAATLLEPWADFVVTPLAAAGLLVLVVLSTVVAYGLQVAAQRVLPAVFVSLLFLLESPFAAFFGWLILDEVVTPSQWVGGLLILAAAGLACIDEAPAEAPVTSGS